MVTNSQEKEIPQENVEKSSVPHDLSEEILENPTKRMKIDDSPIKDYLSETLPLKTNENESED